MLILITLFVKSKPKIICSCGQIISKRQSKTTKSISKGFERSFYWNKYKIKGENKNVTNEYRYFLELNFFDVNRKFAFIYFSRVSDIKRFQTQRFYTPKVITQN